MEQAPYTSDQKVKALRYAQLQLKAAKEELSPEEKQEVQEILNETGFAHEKLIKIATDDIVADQ